jgi:branched-chain amino acid transport system ATP-binding protein
MVGAHCRTTSGFLACALRIPSVGREEASQRAAALEAIRFMSLEPVAHVPAAGLPFATLKRVEAARALAAKPKLLLMDEPAGGLNHEEVSALAALIRTIRDRLGITILLVEHHMSLVMEVSDKVVVLDFGKRIAEGTPTEVQRNPEVIKAYLGE